MFSCCSGSHLLKHVYRKKNSHFFDKRSIGVGEDVSFLSPKRAAGDVEVDPQVGVVSFYRHADVLCKRSEVHQ